MLISAFFSWDHLPINPTVTTVPLRLTQQNYSSPLQGMVYANESAERTRG